MLLRKSPYVTVISNSPYSLCTGIMLTQSMCLNSNPVQRVRSGMDQGDDEQVSRIRKTLFRGTLLQVQIGVCRIILGCSEFIAQMLRARVVFSNFWVLWGAKYSMAHGDFFGKPPEHQKMVCRRSEADLGHMKRSHLPTICTQKDKA